MKNYKIKIINISPPNLFCLSMAQTTSEGVGSKEEFTKGLLSVLMPAVTETDNRYGDHFLSFFWNIFSFFCKLIFNKPQST